MRSEEIFPKLAGLTWGLSHRPKFASEVQTSKALREVRIRYSDQPVFDLTLKYNHLRSGFRNGDPLRQDFDVLRAFFNKHFGSFRSFLFSHWHDNRLENEFFDAADGVRRVFQIGRINGSFEAINSIDFRNRFPKIMDQNGNELEPQSIDANGQIIFTTPPVAGSLFITADFFYRARFADDQIDLTQDYANFWTAPSIRLVATLGDKI